MCFGMDYKDPRVDHYERQYREHVIKQLHRRAAEFGFPLLPQNSELTTEIWNVS